MRKIRASVPLYTFSRHSGYPANCPVACSTILQTRSIIPVGPMCLLQEGNGNHETMEVASDESGSSDATNPCLQWLGTQPPESVLYVAFGSGGTKMHSSLQLHELAEGLEASEKPFLWLLTTPSTEHTIADLLPPGTCQSLSFFACCAFSLIFSFETNGTSSFHCHETHKVVMTLWTSPRRVKYIIMIYEPHIRCPITPNNLLSSSYG